MTIRIPKWAAAVIAVLLVAAVVGGAFLLGRSSSDSEPAPGEPSAQVAEGETEPQAAAGDCSEKAAKNAVERSEFAAAVLATGRTESQLQGLGVAPFEPDPFFDEMTGFRLGTLECEDLTGDGVDEMVVSLNAGATGAVFNWAIFTPDEAGEWQLTFHREGVRVRELKLRGDSVAERSPTYGPDDPTCCPSGSRTTEFTFDPAEETFVLSSPDVEPRERRIIVSSKGATALGTLAPLQASSLDATATFGTPSSILSSSPEACTHSWDDIGLRIVFVNFGGLDACGPEGRIGTASFVGTPAQQAGWKTNDGAQVGMSADQLRQIYPSASTSSKKIELIQQPTGFGDSGVTPALTAFLEEGHALAFQLYVGAGGE